MNLAHPAMQLALAALTRRPVRARITFESACNDCGHRRAHDTARAARRAAWAHETIFGHFALYSSWNGWVRP